MAGEAFLWLVSLLFISLMIWSILRENSRKAGRTVEQYERDVAESRNSLVRAGMLELDKFVGDTSGKRAAVEYLKDEERGQTRAGGRSDDAERTEGKE